MATTCPFCGFAFEGLAADCPRCHRPLALAPPLPPRSPEPPRLGTGQRVAVASVGAATFLAGLAVSFLLALALYFCLDLTGTDSCADEAAAGERLLLGGALMSAALGFFLAWWTAGALRRRNARRATA